MHGESPETFHLELKLRNCRRAARNLFGRTSGGQKSETDTFVKINKTNACLLICMLRKEWRCMAKQRPNPETTMLAVMNNLVNKELSTMCIQCPFASILCVDNPSKSV